MSKKKLNSYFYINYLKKLDNAFSKKQFVKIDKIQKILETKIKNQKNIFICGNGGSASIANHFVCDFNKGVKLSSKKRLKPKIISLTNNNEIITAIANDIKYDKIFTEQIENHISIGDCLIVMSCSGNSKNIVDVVKFAKKKQLYVISLTGFKKNNFVKKYSNLNLNVGIKNYGICEDVFQIVMHMMSQCIRSKFKKKISEIL